MKPELELVTTGSELLNGTVLNRHARWLGEQLNSLGWTLARDTTVPDGEEVIHEALVSALSRSDVVIVTGGLGPTSDDLTREAAARWLGVGIVMHEPSRIAVIDSYRRRNKPLNATVERHALVVEGAEVLANRHGLAPGQHLQKNGRHLFLLPGPPSEFQGVMRDFVLPWLIATGAAASTRSHVFQTAGLGESDIAARLEHTGFHDLAIDVAYCASPSRVTIRVHERIGAERDFDRAIALVREGLSPSIYAESEETIEETVGRLLAGAGQTIAVAESCTGGLIGKRLTDVAGSSAYMQGGVIAYANEVKTNLLGVPAETLATFGAVSPETARAMAEGVRRATGADIGLSVTGIAGPSGGTPQKPVGLVYVGWAGGQGADVRELRLGGPRDLIRESAATLALDLVRRHQQGIV